MNHPDKQKVEELKQEALFQLFKGEAAPDAIIDWLSDKIIATLTAPPASGVMRSAEEWAEEYLDAMCNPDDNETTAEFIERIQRDALNSGRGEDVK